MENSNETRIMCIFTLVRLNFYVKAIFVKAIFVMLGRSESIFLKHEKVFDKVYEAFKLSKDQYWEEVNFTEATLQVG